MIFVPYIMVVMTVLFVSERGRQCEVTMFAMFVGEQGGQGEVAMFVKFVDEHGGQGWLNMAATAKPEASVSIQIGFSGSKCCNTGAIAKVAFSFRNASFASFVKMYDPVFLPFLLPFNKAVRSVAMFE